MARIRVYTRYVLLLKNEIDEIKVRDIVMDNRTHEVWRDGKAVEYDLFQMLLVNKSIVPKRERLIEGV